MSDAPERAALGSKGRWLQVGLVSATAVAPLIARWRALRDDDRAQALRQRAEDIREQASARLAGASQAAQDFQVSLQRASERQAQQANQAALDARARIAEIAQSAFGDEADRRRALRATFWLAGVSAGLLAAGVVSYIVIRNRAMARVENDEMMEIPLDHLTSTPTGAPQPGERPITEAAKSQEPGFAPPPTFSDEDGKGAGWVGDIYTRAYNSMDSGFLPAPMRRTYFATEQQAIDAGYSLDPAAARTPAAPAEPPSENE